jgi:hypothetical protein
MEVQRIPKMRTCATKMRGWAVSDVLVYGVSIGYMRMHGPNWQGTAQNASAKQPEWGYGSKAGNNESSWRGMIPGCHPVDRAVTDKPLRPRGAHTGDRQPQICPRPEQVALFPAQ